MYTSSRIVFVEGEGRGTQVNWIGWKTNKRSFEIIFHIAR